MIQANPTKFFAPAVYRTGSTGMQPGAGTTRHDWYINKHCSYYDDGGCLDAPSRIATGSVRALDCDTFTLGVSQQRRPGVEG